MKWKQNKQQIKQYKRIIASLTWKGVIRDFDTEPRSTAALELNMQKWAEPRSSWTRIWAYFETLAEVLWRENGWVRALIFQNDLQLRNLSCFRGLGTLWANPLGPTMRQPLTLGHSIKVGLTIIICSLYHFDQMMYYNFYWCIKKRFIRI